MGLNAIVATVFVVINLLAIWWVVRSWRRAPVVGKAFTSTVGHKEREAASKLVRDNQTSIEASVVLLTIIIIIDIITASLFFVFS